MVTTLDILKQIALASDRADSFHHGDAHWRAVAQTGWYLAAADPRVDLDVVLLFGALHDTRRENEFKDPRHGIRAAFRLEDLTDPASNLPLSIRQLLLLDEALSIHNGAGPQENPTIGACLDADRLNLWRVGHEPDPALLSTPYAKRPEVIRWARRLCWSYCPPFRLTREILEGLVRPLSWPQLVEAYRALDRERGPSDPRERSAWKVSTFNRHYGSPVT